MKPPRPPQSWTAVPTSELDTLRRAAGEREQLRALVMRLATRVADQSEILSRRAERKAGQATDHGQRTDT